MDTIWRYTGWQIKTNIQGVVCIWLCFNVNLKGLYKHVSPESITNDISLPAVRQRGQNKCPPLHLPSNLEYKTHLSRQ